MWFSRCEVSPDQRGASYRIRAARGRGELRDVDDDEPNAEWCYVRVGGRGNSSRPGARAHMLSHHYQLGPGRQQADKMLVSRT
jgi:hypothetical protein